MVGLIHAGMMEQLFGHALAVRQKYILIHWYLLKMILFWQDCHWYSGPAIWMYAWPDERTHRYSVLDSQGVCSPYRLISTVQQSWQDVAFGPCLFLCLQHYLFWAICLFITYSMVPFYPDHFSSFFSNIHTFLTTLLLICIISTQAQAKFSRDFKAGDLSIMNQEPELVAVPDSTWFSWATNSL